MSLYNTLPLVLVALLMPSVLKGSLHCITVESEPSISIASAVCPPRYSLLSCGFKSIGLDSNSRGSFIRNGTCFASNNAMAYQSGVSAMARCCDLSSENLSCRSYISNASGALNDDYAAQSCQKPTQTLFGCSAFTTYNYLNGAYPSSSHRGSKYLTSELNFCLGRNGVTKEESVTFSFATCCEPEQEESAVMECNAVWSKWRPNVEEHNVSCPKSEQFMTSCSFSDAWGRIDRWFVSSDGVCHGRNTKPEALASPGKYAESYLVAMCCQVASPTASPTTAPVHSTAAPSLSATYSKANVGSPTASPITGPVHSTTAPSLSPTYSEANAVDVTLTFTGKSATDFRSSQSQEEPPSQPQPPPQTQPPLPSQPQPQPQPQPRPQPQPQPQPQHPLSNQLMLAIIVLSVVLFAVLCLLGFFVFAFWRYRARQSQQGKEGAVVEGDGARAAIHNALSDCEMHEVLPINESETMRCTTDGEKDTEWLSGDDQEGNNRKLADWNTPYI